MSRRRKRPTAPQPTPVHFAPIAPTPDDPVRRSAWRRLATAGAVMVGGFLWLLAGNDLTLWRGAIVLGVVLVSLFPPVTRLLAKLLERLRRPSPRTVEWTGLLVGVAATAYLTATALLQQRPLAPRMFDESSYAIGAQLLARGRLWLPQHPLADFFDSFFLVVRPVYSSIYFPGAALAFAPAVWFGWATWIVPIVLAGVVVGLLYRIITALTNDGAAGLLAALWMVSLMAFRALSVMTMSHIVMIALGLLLIWSWLRWRGQQERRWAWTLIIGALSGWAAITRPVDALAFALPVGAAMALALRGQPMRQYATTAALLVLGATPFLSLQVIHNVGVTGHALRTPYTDYLQREQPGTQYGIHPYDPAQRPESDSPRMNAYYNWCRPYLQHHQPHNFFKPWFAAQPMAGGRVQSAHFFTLADATLPAHALLLLLPAGLIALAEDRRRLVLAATLPLFLFLYVFNPFFLPHYTVVIAPAMILLALLGADAVARAANPGQRGNAVRVAMTMAILALAATSLWEVRWFFSPAGPPPRDGFQEGAPQSQVENALTLLVDPPAVVLFGPAPELWTEMVYNVDVAWPDDAPIIRARDLGPRNAEIIDYYGQHQPNRVFYRFDWQRGSLQRLGDAGTLRDRLRAGTPLETLMSPP